MSYVDPRSVTSPRSRLSDLQVLYDGGPGEWAIASFKWDSKPSLGIRWNGRPDEDGVGSPQSRGLPTWFVFPGELQGLVLERLSTMDQLPLAAGYQEMARDHEREREATEWIEGLVADASPQR